jgi:hypothetical protein
MWQGHWGIRVRALPATFEELKWIAPTRRSRAVRVTFLERTVERLVGVRL